MSLRFSQMRAIRYWYNETVCLFHGEVEISSQDGVVAGAQDCPKTESVLVESIIHLPQYPLCSLPFEDLFLSCWLVKKIFYHSTS